MILIKCLSVLLTILIVLRLILQQYVISKCNKLLKLKPLKKYIPYPLMIFENINHALINVDNTRIILYEFGTKFNKARILSKSQTKKLILKFEKRCNEG